MKMKTQHTQILWDAVRSVATREIYSQKIYIKKREESNINNLILHLEEPEEEKIKPKAKRKKEIIKIRGK